MRIGSIELNAPLALAPMAGITDKPFRMLARRFGAGLASSEMTTSDPSLQNTRKTLQRANHEGETGIRSVQIVGNIPEVMAEAAQLNVARGAQIIDINMGCPAKKVCNVLAGSALLKDEGLVKAILQAVVQSVDVPVTLKTRLGWDDEHLNVPKVASIAMDAGIQALAIHGRSRTQMYTGHARYELIAEVKKQIDIPLWVNGDITSAAKAVQVLEQTGADGVMIGRGAQGQPWLFRDVKAVLQTGVLPEALLFQDAANVVLEHLTAIHGFYGEHGVKIARKHLLWYLGGFECYQGQRSELNQVAQTSLQYEKVAELLHQLSFQHDTWPRREQ
ncbi:MULTISPECIES: tRNA dihydrouridine synthase DusB [Vitreoscilla]|uniref:tRNA-dihydrouridine synthase n=1 Tax=Vitreoscilla stercoraria TaxID=61 RepID=A0ABY4EAZ3_VITST|nr:MULTISPECIES: tRNA dihydrouridine synthase DusB [Vitreoscilla]QJQ52356.1 tRNA-dihydrouridine synthase B [Vitreoscilla sp. C1]UOO92920.1 tRNA dihydrouridine synthase DusB [Vitreoscilla stercoraria]